MRVHITLDADEDKPIVCLEADTSEENAQLELLASFDKACFRLIVREEEVAS